MSAELGGTDRFLLDGEGNLISVYSELRRLAAAYLSQERGGHTLQPTALVHEAYLRLLEQDRVDWDNRSQLIGLAAQLMRRILIDHARARAATKRTRRAGEIRIAFIRKSRWSTGSTWGERWSGSKP
jgi:RNA polymerase sigma factor (TIGR02999 family)